MKLLILLLLAIIPRSAYSQVAAADTGLQVFTKLDVEAQFPGGGKKWQRFLSRNLNVDVPWKNGAPPGTYNVTIQFSIEKDGTLGEIKPLTSLGFGMEEEVTRVIRLSPKWKPGKMNNHPAKAYKIQAIIFVVSPRKKYDYR